MMQTLLEKKMLHIPVYAWVLLVIIVVGTFLRVYQFHEWVEFKGDQARDAALVHDVVIGKSSWPLLGSYMTGTGMIGANSMNAFHLGPMYYYFQIISAEIFGDSPDRLAYFDLMCSIFSIPLLFVFLKKYFSQCVALGLTSLYALSFFSIRYAHFAWNVNSIPFFVLLFLLSLYEVLIQGEKIRWRWVITLGVTLGVGFQLHAILLVLFPAVSFFVFLFLMRKDCRIWKKLAVVLGIFLVLNTGQIVSEIQTGFANSKIFLRYFLNNQREDGSNSNFFTKVANDIDCHAEGNFYMLTSLDEDNCSLSLAQLVSREKSKSFLKSMDDPVFRFILFGGFAYVFFGYFLFISAYKNEEDMHKKYFLGLIAFYMALSLLVMFPISKEKMELRYFSYAFFLPFLFFGFFVDFLKKRFPRSHPAMVVILFLVFFISNVSTIISTAEEFSEKDITKSYRVILGEVEPVAEYLVSHSDGRNNVYLSGDTVLMAYVYRPLEYLAERRGVYLVKAMSDRGTHLVKAMNDKSAPAISPLFYLSTRPSERYPYEQIGKLYVYQIQ